MKESKVSILAVEELISSTKKYLESLNYSVLTLNEFNTRWKKLQDYADNIGVANFTEELCDKFLKSYCKIDSSKIGLTTYQMRTVRAITILVEYYLRGTISTRKLMKAHQWATEYHEVCENFFNNHVEKNLSERTQRTVKMHLKRFTDFLAHNTAKNISNITMNDVNTYIIKGCKDYSKKTLAYAMYVLRKFFSFAYNNNYIRVDLSVCIPKIHVDPKAGIPDVYTENEIKRLLKAVDRGNPCGKRDYAMLLLAIRYGMRVGEIRNLKLSDLNFETNVIEYTQSKTSNVMKVDIVPEIGWALIDYLKNGRPKTDTLNVFVRHIVPFVEFGKNANLHSTISKYMEAAKIKVSPSKKHGMHALRHSLASNLLKQGVPLHVISEVLGHGDLNTTTIYTKIDIKQLNLCALEVPYENK